MKSPVLVGSGSSTVKRILWFFTILVIVILSAGCTSPSSTDAITPTQTPVPKISYVTVTQVTFSVPSTGTATTASVHSPKYIPGDIIAIAPEAKTEGWMIVSYKPETDEYIVQAVIYDKGAWRYDPSNAQSYDRLMLERNVPVLIVHINPESARKAGY